jgi:hypothetical protein
MKNDVMGNGLRALVLWRMVSLCRSAPKAFTTKYRPSVNRASLTLLKKAKTDLGGFLRYRGGAKVAAADDTASVGSVAESQTESYSGGSSNPYKNRVSREGSAGVCPSLTPLDLPPFSCLFFNFIFIFLAFLSSGTYGG